LDLGVLLAFYCFFIFSEWAQVIKSEKQLLFMLNGFIPSDTSSMTAICSVRLGWFGHHNLMPCSTSVAGGAP